MSTQTTQDGDLVLNGVLDAIGGIANRGRSSIHTTLATSVAQQSIAQGRYVSISASLADMSNDDRLTPQEKTQALLEWEQIATEQPIIVQRAIDSGIGALVQVRVDYAAAYTALYQYLFGTGGCLVSMTTTTDIVGTTFRATWIAYSEARELLLQAIQAQITNIFTELTNDTHTVPTANDGTGGNYYGCETTISIYVGAKDDTANWSVVAAPSAGITGSLTGKTYTVTDMSTDAGYVDLTASRTGFVAVVKRFTISKAKTGGLTTVYKVTTNAAAITRTIAGVFIPVQFEASGFSQSGTGGPTAYAGRFQFAVCTDGTNFDIVSTSSADETTRQLTMSSYASAKMVRVRLYEAGGTSVLLDEETISIVADGATGPMGPAGGSVTWLGSLSAFPNPGVDSTAFYHTGDRKSYVYNEAGGATYFGASTLFGSSTIFFGGKWYVMSVDSPFMQAEYSTDGTTWVSTATASTIYVRWSSDGGISWSAAVNVKGPSGNFIDYIFCRSASAPATPTGDGTPAGWYDAPPAGTNPLYFSTAEKTAANVLVGYWATPARLDGTFSVEWSVTGTTGTWHSTYAPGDLYMRTSTDGGNNWTSAILVKGEGGVQGTPGPVYLGAFTSDPETPNLGDYYLQLNSPSSNNVYRRYDGPGTGWTTITDAATLRKYISGSFLDILEANQAMNPGAVTLFNYLVASGLWAQTITLMSGGSIESDNYTEDPSTHAPLTGFKFTGVDGVLKAMGGVFGGSVIATGPIYRTGVQSTPTYVNYRLIPLKETISELFGHTRTLTYIGGSTYRTYTNNITMRSTGAVSFRIGIRSNGSRAMTAPFSWRLRIKINGTVVYEMPALTTDWIYTRAENVVYGDIVSFEIYTSYSSSTSSSSHYIDVLTSEALEPICTEAWYDDTY